MERERERKKKTDRQADRWRERRIERRARETDRERERRGGKNEREREKGREIERETQRGGDRERSRERERRRASTTFRSISGFSLPSMRHNTKLSSTTSRCPIFEISATALCGIIGVWLNQHTKKKRDPAIPPTKTGGPKKIDVGWANGVQPRTPLSWSCLVFNTPLRGFQYYRIGYITHVPCFFGCSSHVTTETTLFCP